MEWTTTIVALTVAYFLLASITTFEARLIQAKRRGELPADHPLLPSWTAVFIAAQWVVFLVLLYLNWKYAVVLFVVKFVLKVLPVLETIGNIFMAPLRDLQVAKAGARDTVIARMLVEGVEGRKAGVLDRPSLSATALTCPACGLANPRGSLRCFCGSDLARKKGLHVVTKVALGLFGALMLMIGLIALRDCTLGFGSNGTAKSDKQLRVRQGIPQRAQFTSGHHVRHGE